MYNLLNYGIQWEILSDLSLKMLSLNLPRNKVTKPPPESSEKSTNRGELELYFFHIYVQKLENIHLEQMIKIILFTSNICI